jgi:transposase
MKMTKWVASGKKMKTEATVNHEVRILPQIDKACGLDMHKDKIVLFISDKEGKQQVLQEFGAFTKDLYAIRDLVLQYEVKHAVMESTGVYWMSLYYILTKAGIDVVIANPAQVKQIPKRKTDRKDAKWLCTLLLNGLIRPSFIADGIQLSLRQYCRSRLGYTQMQSRTYNRIIKIIETNNIKIRSAISNLHTITAMEIIRLLAAGETDIEKMIKCVKGRARKKIPLMRLALQGTLQSHDLLTMQMLLSDIDHNQKQIDRLDKLIDQIIEQHYAQVVQCLDNISGIGIQSAQIIVSEMGDNMRRFPSSDHLTAWCGVAPGNNESAGKRKSTATKKGNKYLRMAIIAAAWGAVRTKDSYWRGLFEHLKKRMKAMKAIVVIARKLLKVVYKTIDNKMVYTEKGIDHFLKIHCYNKLKETSKLAY